MPDLLSLLPSTKYGFAGQQPPQFDLGPNSTLDNQSSLNNTPAFSTYADPNLKGLQATKLAPTAAQVVPYLSNPPQ